MDLTNKYNIYAGTARGVLQCTSCNPKEKVAFSVPESKSQITALEWGRSENEIIIGYKNEQLQLFNTTLNKYTETFKKLEGDGPIVGVGFVNQSILVAKRDGIISIFDGKKSDYFSINLEENGTLDAVGHNKSRENIIGTGGESNDFKLWDIETKQCTFKAKSLPHDYLNLPVPTSIRGITSLSENESLNACATKEGQVLLYDERSQRRPIVKFFEKKASYTCITNSFRERQCLVGTSRGYMQLIDLRSPGKCLRTFADFAGSVTCIVCDPNNPFVISTSLDRFLRIHHLETKQLLFKIYLKQNLTKVLMKPIVKEEQTEKMLGPVVDQEYEDIFENMETLEDAKKVKSKRKSSQEVTAKKKKTAKVK